ncbi:MAG: sugar phosphate isomerase/epimerase family protein [Bryobacteraceae bacterium]
MQITRRSLLAAPAAVALTPAPAPAALSLTRNKIGVSTYSYWHFSKEKYPIEKVIDNAARIGFDGVEILHRQMAEESAAYCNKLKRHAFTLGLDLYMLSIHQNFVSPDANVRKEHIEHTVRCIQLAARLGIPAIRLNSGRWGTVKSFDELMKVKGNEPPLPGYTNDNAFQWCIDSIQECLPHAEREGVLLALENHWGLTTQPEGVLRIWKAVNSPWLGINMDTGNYATDPYPEIEKLASHATIVQAKTYYGGGVWYTLDLDYPRIAGILRKHNFRGWISLEMEGKGDADESVAKSYDVLRKAFAA